MSEINTEGRCPYCGFDLYSGEYIIQPHQLKPGTLLRDRYIIGKVIGEGGFGITYVGMDDFFGVKVAIKEFYMTGFVNRNNTYSAKVSAETGEKGELFTKNRERFYAEAKVLVKFSNIDGISKIRDFFYENDTAYIVMEYLQGRTLQSILKEKKTLSVDETLKIVTPILKALEVVHKDNIIHRDISPDNIIITDDGKPWLIDFGAAREFAEDDMKSLSVILKHGYAPEEQYRRRGVQGPWTDVYAICATMYRCISGKRPDDALERLVEDETVELCVINPHCPKELSDIIMHGLSIRAKNRYQSVEEMLVDIEKTVNFELVQTSTQKQLERNEKRDDSKRYSSLPERENKDNNQTGKKEINYLDSMEVTEVLPVNNGEKENYQKEELPQKKRKKRKGFVFLCISILISLIVLTLFILAPGIEKERVRADYSLAHNYRDAIFTAFFDPEIRSNYSEDIPTNSEFKNINSLRGEFRKEVEEITGMDVSDAEKQIKSHHSSNAEIQFKLDHTISYNVYICTVRITTTDSEGKKRNLEEYFITVD